MGFLCFPSRVGPSSSCVKRYFRSCDAANECDRMLCNLRVYGLWNVSRREPYCFVCGVLCQRRNVIIRWKRSDCAAGTSSPSTRFTDGRNANGGARKKKAKRVTRVHGTAISSRRGRTNAIAKRGFNTRGRIEWKRVIRYMQRLLRSISYARTTDSRRRFGLRSSSGFRPFR